MRYTENRNGVIVVPKRFHDAAIEKLARYEDTGLEPEQIVRLRDALMKISVFLDEIDGQLIDDPVSVIREKVEEVLG